jgi:hypothetical protein
MALDIRSFPGVVRAEHRWDLCQHAGGQGEVWSALT